MRSWGKERMRLWCWISAWFFSESSRVMLEQINPILSVLSHKFLSNPILLLLMANILCCNQRWSSSILYVLYILESRYLWPVKKRTEGDRSPSWFSIRDAKRIQRYYQETKDAGICSAYWAVWFYGVEMREIIYSGEKLVLLHWERDYSALCFYSALPFIIERKQQYPLYRVDIWIKIDYT